MAYNRSCRGLSLEDDEAGAVFRKVNVEEKQVLAGFRDGTLKGSISKGGGVGKG